MNSCLSPAPWPPGAVHRACLVSKTVARDPPPAHALGLLPEKHRPESACPWAMLLSRVLGAIASQAGSGYVTDWGTCSPSGVTRRDGPQGCTLGRGGGPYWGQTQDRVGGRDGCRGQALPGQW